MKISGTEKSSQGQNFHFHAWNYHFHVWKFHISMRENEIFIMKFSCLDFLLYETFRTSISTKRNNFEICAIELRLQRSRRPLAEWRDTNLWRRGDDVSLLWGSLGCMARGLCTHVTDDT